MGSSQSNNNHNTVTTEERINGLNALSSKLKYREEECLKAQEEYEKCLESNLYLSPFMCYSQKEKVRVSENTALRAKEIYQLALKSNKDVAFCSNGKWEY